jgi:hypothetical protein
MSVLMNLDIVRTPVPSFFNAHRPHTVVLLTRTATHDTQVSVRQLLEYHIRWAKKAKEVDEVHTQWLYALLSRLDKPIDADMASALRSLLRRLAEDRSRLVLSMSCRVVSCRTHHGRGLLCRRANKIKRCLR